MLPLLALWIMSLSAAKAQTRAAEILVDSLKNKNQTTAGNPVSSRPIWLFSPLRVVDSTSTGLQPFSIYTRNDTVKAWLNRSISGDRFSATLRVRSLGRNESDIAAGLAAMSKGNDSAYAAVNVTASGQVQLGGRRQPGGSAFTSFLDAYYDSLAFWIAAVQRLHLNSSRFYVRDTLLVGQSTNPSTPVRAFVNGDVRFDGTTRLFSTDATSNVLTVRGTTAQSGRLATFRTVADVAVAEIGSGGEISTWYGMTLYPSVGYANYLTIKAGNTSASYELTLPTAQGAASTYLKNNGSGTLSWDTVAGSWTVLDTLRVGSSTNPSTPVRAFVNGDVRFDGTTRLFSTDATANTLTVRGTVGQSGRLATFRTVADVAVAEIGSGGEISTWYGMTLYPSVGYANYLTIKAGNTSASYELTLPTAQGAANTYLKNDGTGTLSFATISAGSTATDTVWLPVWTSAHDTLVDAAVAKPILYGANTAITKIYAYLYKDTTMSRLRFYGTEAKTGVDTTKLLLYIDGSLKFTRNITGAGSSFLSEIDISSVSNGASHEIKVDFSQSGGNTYKFYNAGIEVAKSLTTAAASGTGLDSTAVDTLSVMYVPATSGIIATSSTTTNWAADTTMRVVMFEMPHAFRVDTVYHRQLAASANDTIVYALFDRDGNQKWRTVVQLTTGGTTNTYSMAVVTPILVPAGSYYWAWMQSGGYNPNSQMTFTDAQMDALVSMNTLEGYGLPAHSGTAANKWSPSANSVPSTLGTITRRATTDNWVPPVAIMVGAK